MDLASSRFLANKEHDMIQTISLCSPVWCNTSYMVDNNINTIKLVQLCFNSCDTLVSIGGLVSAALLPLSFLH